MPTLIFQRIKDFSTCLKNRGIISTFLVFLSTIMDKFGEYGAHPNGKDLKLENSEHSNIYLPTRATPFKKLLDSGLISKTGAFVDYGAGLGRPMVLASQNGFKIVRGIEFSKELYNLGKGIIKPYSKLYPEVFFDYIMDDVINYEPNDKDTVFYFYDPFSKVILNRCLDNILSSIYKNPRKVELIYHYNLKTKLEDIMDSKMFSLKKVFTYMGNQFFIYQNNL